MEDEEYENIISGADLVGYHVETWLELK